MLLRQQLFFGQPAALSCDDLVARFLAYNVPHFCGSNFLLGLLRVRAATSSLCGLAKACAMLRSFWAWLSSPIAIGFQLCLMLLGQHAADVLRSDTLDYFSCVNYTLSGLANLATTFGRVPRPFAASSDVIDGPAARSNPSQDGYFASRDFIIRTQPLNGKHKCVFAVSSPGALEMRILVSTTIESVAMLPKSLADIRAATDVDGPRNHVGNEVNPALHIGDCSTTMANTRAT